MNMSPEKIYAARKEFFNESAEKWIDMWYRDPETGKQTKHDKDFENLLAHMPLAEGDCVLDAGCGTGILAPYLLSRIGKTGMLYEIDFAEKMIETNRKLHRQENIRFIVSDVEHVPLADATCDVAVCFSCFPHFQDKPQAIRTLSRILKSRGVLVIAHFASSDGINHHHKSCRAVMHDRLPDEATMRAMIADGGFEIETFVDREGFYYIQARKK